MGYCDPIRPNAISAALAGVYGGMIAVSSFLEISFSPLGYAVLPQLAKPVLAIVLATLAADMLISLEEESCDLNYCYCSRCQYPRSARR